MFSSVEFRTIELTLRGPIGRCPNAGDVVNATLSRTEDGSARMEGTLAPEVEPMTFVEAPFEPVSVSACDADTLQALIEAVPATRECVSGDGACDPCLVVFLEVDEEEAAWSLCCQADGLVEYTESFLAVVDAIEELAP